MKGTYAYSLDHENYHGIYNTRTEAAEAAFAHAGRAGLSINQVFVGQRVLGDPQANLQAWSVIKSMRERARAVEAAVVERVARDGPEAGAHRPTPCGAGRGAARGRRTSRPCGRSWRGRPSGSG